MRPIKFRVYNKILLRMFYDNEVAIQFFNGSWRYGILDNNFTGNYKTLLDDSMSIPMQFTGLHDSTGKEIYEGDILHIEHFIFYVCYANGAFIVKENKESDTYFSLSNINKFSLIMANIHENPKLLETK